MSRCREEEEAVALVKELTRLCSERAVELWRTQRAREGCGAKVGFASFLFVMHAVSGHLEALATAAAPPDARMRDVIDVERANSLMRAEAALGNLRKKETGS